MHARGQAYCCGDKNELLRDRSLGIISVDCCSDRAVWDVIGADHRRGVIGETSAAPGRCEEIEACDHAECPDLTSKEEGEPLEVLSWEYFGFQIAASDPSFTKVLV